MSLLTDQDYFLQSLRLAFLRLDTPVSAHSTSHLVQPKPTFALSQHAFYAGLTAEHVPDFGLSRSPGPVPSTSAAAASAGRRSPYSKDRSFNRGPAEFRNRDHAAAAAAAGPPLPFPALGGDGNTDGGPGTTGLKHSTTIVGRHGERSAGTGAAAGIRVKGRRSRWRPKPHHLGQQHSETNSAYNTPRADHGDTLPGRMQDPAAKGAQYLYEDDTPQPSRRPSRASNLADQDEDHESDEYDQEEEDESTDEELDNASSDTDDGMRVQNAASPPPPQTSASGRRYNSHRAESGLHDGVSSRRPYSDRALSEAIVGSNMSHSPSDSYGYPASASRRDGNSLIDSANSISPAGSSAAQPSSLRAPGTRARKGDLERADTLSMNISPLLDERLAEVDSEEEEDDFQFSLPGGDGSSPTTFLSSQPERNIANSVGGVTTFVSPPNTSGILPSIAEAAEMNEQLPGNGPDLGEPSQAGEAAHETGQLSEEAALKAAQSARRRARRRVNISGRTPLKLNIAPSPEVALGTMLSPTSPRLRSGSAGSSRPHSPVMAMSGAKGADAMPTSPAGYSSSPLFRTKSGKIIRRQRAQTEPVPLSGTNTPMPSPSLPRTRSSDSQHPLRTVNTPPGADVPGTQTPKTQRTTSLTSSPVSKPRDAPSADLLPTPTKGVPPRRARSTGAGEASPFKLHHTNTGSHSANGTDGTPNAEAPPSMLRPSPHKSHSRGNNNDPYITFPIRKMPVQNTPAPAQSALSAMLRQEDTGTSSAGNNPFNELYGALFAPEKPPVPRRRFGTSRNDDSGDFVVTMYYPFSKDPSKPIKMALKSDLIVEEVIGCALWKYWESERQPSLLPDAQGKNDEKWDEASQELQARLKASHYILRIADEDEDGEVDDDFPAPERVRPAKGFGNCFAVVPASPAQAKQYQQSDAHIQRRPSRIIKKITRPPVSPQPSATNLDIPGAVPGGGSLMPPTATSQLLPAGGGGMSSAASYISASFAGTPTKASFNPAGSASLVLVRIRIPLKGVEDVTTAVKVPLDMYLADVLEMLCKKRNLGNPRDWVLVVPDRGIVVPLDRTVESLQGVYHLALQKKSAMPHGGNAATGTRTKTGIVNTNPNASIFKRLSEPPQPRYVTSADLNTNYRSYVVQRKMPMPLGRHERVLSLDNDYIHIMPSDTKLASGTVRTASYHISQVASCKTSKRAPSSFKLVVWRNKDRDVKRYDFEAANGRMAAEIVQTVQALMHAYKEGLEREHNNV